jgi:hypothetical protein
MINRKLSTLLFAGIASMFASIASAQSVANCIKIEEWEKAIVVPDFNSTELDIYKGCGVAVGILSGPETAADNVAACFLTFCATNQSTSQCIPKSNVLKKVTYISRLKQIYRCP